MLKQTTVQIGEDTFLLTSYPAIKGLKYQKKLAKVLLPAFAEITKHRDSGATDEESFGYLLSKLAEHLDEIDEEMVREMIIEGCTKNSIRMTSQSFDMEFSADYSKLFQLFQEIVRFNFGSVFSEIGSAAL